MKASLTWMNDYVQVDMTKSPQELADKLTQAGIPVEEVLTVDEGIRKVYTGKIIKIEKHPDADRLQVCTLECLEEDGTPVNKQIITAATNVAEGQIVPVAYHKSKLAGGKHISKGKMRGLMSEGMLCSTDELGIGRELVLPEVADGIFILPPDTPVGKDIKDVLLLNDIVYDFELTPNRADCFSMAGLSREFAVMTGQQAVMPEIVVEEKGAPAKDRVRISIDDAELCRRFAARLVTNIKIGPSPLWMQNRLRNSGMRPINNVVDVTNYVMLELGQPMHAYDYDHVKGHHLTARRAADGEVLKTLDGNDRELTSSMLVIADDERAVGVAGVMGGFDSEVTAATTSVLFESAVFKSSSVRRTARALGMRSEASGRYERGVNPEFSPLAIDRAVQLLCQICPGCEVAEGIVDEYPQPQEERYVTFKASQVNEYLGTKLDPAYMTEILETLQFAITVSSDGDTMTAAIPSWRADVTVMPDIAEEVARIYGYDNIPATTPWAALSSGTLSPRKELAQKVGHYLARAGLSEIVTFSFMHKDSLPRLLIPETDSRYQAIPIMNPISEEFPVMRTTLIPGTLDAAVRNLAQQNQDMWLFETGAVFEPKSLPLTELPTEHLMTCGVILGQAGSNQWTSDKRMADFYDVKGIVTGLLTSLGIENLTIERASEPYLHPGISAVYKADGVTLATFGELHPQAAKNYDLPGKAYLFELDLQAILSVERHGIRYAELSKFPGTARDLAIVAPLKVSSDEIMAVIKEHGGQYLENAYLFDVYEGIHIAPGYRSLAYSLSFRSSEGTLTDGDIEPNIKAIIDALAEKDCKLR